MAHAFSFAAFATGSWEGLLISHLGLLFFSSSPIEHCVDNGAGVEGRSPIGQFSSPPCFPTISSSFPSHFLFLSLSFSFRHACHHFTISPARLSPSCWDLRLEKLSKSLSKIMIAAEGVESKHSTSWKHQEWMISSSILGDPII